MEHLELNQVALREDMNVMIHKVGQMLEALLALSKNNFQHVIIENVDPTSGFTVVNNPLYDSPPQMDDHIWPQLVYIAISNKIPIVKGHSTVQVGHIPPPNSTEKSQFAHYAQNPQEVHPTINVRTH